LRFEVKFKMRSRSAICAFCLLLILSAVLPASELRVDNAILKADVVPGEKIRHEMTVRIGGDDQPVEAVAEVKGFGTNVHGSIDLVDPDDDLSPYSAREFFEINPGSFWLEPGVPVTVVLEGEVPKDVGSGGRYALVDIHTAPQGTGTVGVATAVIVPIYLTIKGTEILKTGEIDGIEVSDEGVLSIFYENTGNYHYGVTAEVTLTDDAGEVVKNFTTQKGTSLPAVTYPFTIPLNPDGDLAPGTYTVEAEVTLEDGTVLDTAETTIEV